MEEKIYLKVARELENDLLAGRLREGSQIPSTHQIAERHHINAATAARGVSVLSGMGLLEKQRGVGMFVAEGAREKIIERRREAFREGLLQECIREAALLGISKRDLIAILMR